MKPFCCPEWLAGSNYHIRLNMFILIRNVLTTIAVWQRWAMEEWGTGQHILRAVERDWSSGRFKHWVPRKNTKGQVKIN